MKTLAGRVELFANVAIIVVALLIGGVLVKKYLFTDQAPPKAPDIIGTRANLTNVNWQKNRLTLVAVLSKDCRFCTQSAPFYQRLVKEAAARDRVGLVAVLPQSVEVGKSYLEELGVAITDVHQASPASLGVRGTPTLILIDNNGIILDSWVGALPPEKEAEVIAKL